MITRFEPQSVVNVRQVLLTIITAPQSTVVHQFFVARILTT